ncbi:MAG: hypothetical protein ACRDRS_07545 [Pseudonocardiaceae bacterium]
MTSPDPHAIEARAVAARIKAETGIDVLDSSADAAGARAAMRRAWRQVGGTLGSSLAGTLALLCIVLAVVPGNGGATISLGVRATFAVFGLAMAVASTALIVWGWRTPAAYTELYLKRRQAQKRFFTEIGQPRPSEFEDASWLMRKAMIAFSTPSEVRAMRAEAASREPPPVNPEQR